MELEDIKKQFSELMETYDLPDFDQLDKEFEIRDISNENTILKDIRERILDKFDQYIKILEGIVQPDTTLVNMYESKVFSDEEKGDIFNLYKRFIFLERFSLQTELEDGDAKIAEFINTAFQEWNRIKGEVLGIIIRLKDSWTENDDPKNKVEYMG